jgi:hypothetical protein
MIVRQTRIMRPWRSTLLKASVVGLVPAILVGAAVLYISWSDNLSMTIRDENGVDWAYWLLLGASWALPTFVLFTAVAAVILRFTRVP